MQAARSVVIFFLISLFFCGLVEAQDKTNETKVEPTPEKDKARLELEKNALDLADSAANEANGLKLWENRALIYALAGDLLWKTDQKRARQLFQNAANELSLGNAVPKEKPKDYYDDYGWWQDFSPRHAVLQTIATYDADWALELLQETRPPDLQAAIIAQSQPQVPSKQPKTQAQTLNEQKNKYKVQREIQLEQSFAVKAAEQNPKKAAKLIRESLKKGVSSSAIELIYKVRDKDEELANELLNEIVQKIIDTDFKQKDEVVMIAGQFLFQSGSPELMKSYNPKFKPLKVDEKYLKEIANKLADHYLQSTDRRNSWQIAQISTAIEKYAPEKAAQLKKLIPEEQKSRNDINNLLSNPDTKPEKLLEEAEKFAGYEKYELYRAAVDKFAETGQGEKVRELLKNVPESKQRDDALAYLDEKLSAKAIKDDKLDDVQKIISKTESETSKVKLLVDLAVGFQKKNTKESRENALKLMEDARRLVSSFPENDEDVADMLKLASGYAVIEPDKAFPYLTTLIEMTNDLLTAGSLIAKYNRRNFAFKQGEMIFTNNFGYGVSSYTKYSKELSLLAAADFGRTKGLIDQLRRDDTRVLFKIALAQSILKEKIGADGLNFYYSGF